LRKDRFRKKRDEKEKPKKNSTLKDVGKAKNPGFNVKDRGKAPGKISKK